MSSDMLALAARCKSAKPALEHLLVGQVVELLRASGRLPLAGLPPILRCLGATAFLDVAMLLLPPSAVNFELFNHTRDGGQQAWSCSFHDRAQQMGERAAHEEIERLQKAVGSAWEIAREPRVVLEKAIAEHWLEFHGTASTAALAVCIAVLRARVSQEVQDA